MSGTRCGLNRFFSFGPSVTFEYQSICVFAGPEIICVKFKLNAFLFDDVVCFEWNGPNMTGISTRALGKSPARKLLPGS